MVIRRRSGTLKGALENGMSMWIGVLALRVSAAGCRPARLDDEFLMPCEGKLGEFEVFCTFIPILWRGSF